jgi:hypothetical protein
MAMNNTNDSQVDATVSVVIPLYNKEKYVERAISSIRAQTYHPLEIIVVDDGSTDNGPKKVIALNNPMITLLRQENRGPGAARNAGLAIAGGKYVAFLDADDEWYPSFLSIGISYLENHSFSATVAATGYVALPSNRQNSEGLMNLNGIYEITPDTDIILIQAMERFIHLCFTVMRKDTARNLCGYFDKFKCLRGEDTYFLLKLLFNEKIYIIPEPHGLYHREASELYGCNTTDASPSLQPYFTNPEDIISSCPQHKRDILSKYLSLKALSSAVTYCKLGQKEKAVELIDRFCRNGHFTKQAAAVRVMAEFAPLLPSVRKIWRSINQIAGN